MKLLKTVTALSLMLLATGASAETVVTTMINGNPVAKDLTKLTFSDNIVTLTFSDNTTESAEMNFVSIVFDYDGNSAISEVINDVSKPKGIYNLNGQYLGESAADLQPGFYIVDGQKVYIK